MIASWYVGGDGVNYDDDYGDGGFLTKRLVITGG